MVAETPEQVAAREEDVKAKRTAYVAELTQSYQLSKEDRETAMLDPGAVLPQLAANLHARVVEETIRHVHAMLPSALQNITKTSDTESQARSHFFGKWPGLKDPRYAAAIVTAGTMYRKLNPKASAEEAVDKIGRLVYTTLGQEIPEDVAGAAPKKPFKPTNPGGGGSRATTTKSKPKPADDEPDWAALADGD